MIIGIVMVFICFGVNQIYAFNQLHRDPFCLPRCITKNTKKLSFSLLGIVREGDRFGALIGHNKQSTIVFAQDIIVGYTVAQVTSEYVRLVREDEQIIVKLEHDE